MTNFFSQVVIYIRPGEFREISSLEKFSGFFVPELLGIAFSGHPKSLKMQKSLPFRPPLLKKSPKIAKNSYLHLGVTTRFLDFTTKIFGPSRKLRLVQNEKPCIQQDNCYAE